MNFFIFFLPKAVVLKLFVTADPFHCTRNRCGPFVLSTFFRLLRN